MMNVYLFILILTVIVGVSITGNKRNVDIILLSRRHTNIRTIYCTLFAIAIILLIGLRANSVGSDTLNYYNSYRLDNMSFSYFYSEYREYLKQGILNFMGEKNSLLFHLVFSFFSRLGFSFNTCLVVLASIYVTPIVYLISKESDNVWKSCFWYLVINLSISLTGVRISLAIGLTAISYICLLKKKKIISVIVLSIAIMIHLSAIVFVGAFILSKIKISRKLLMPLIPAFVIMPLIGRYVAPFLLSFTYHDSQDNQWNLPIYLFFSITSILFLWSQDENRDKYLKMIIMGTIVCGLINFGAFGNLHKYYTQYLCICLPGLFKNYNKSTRIMIELSYIIVGLYLFAKSYIWGSVFLPYKFFWQ